MPYASQEATTPSPPINDLAKAVARWEYEGGAGVEGPQEGYGGSIEKQRVAKRTRASDTFVERLTLAQMVRLLFAASAFRKLPSSNHRSNAFDPESRGADRDQSRISQSLVRIIDHPRAGFHRSLRS